jgi:imidazolonepropionase-like amidohydrolase
MMRPPHLALAVTAFSAVAAVAAFGCVPAPPADLAITRVSMVDVEGGRLLEDQTILVRDGRIASVGPAEQTTVPAGARIVDGSGRYLIPGLADMHVHLSLGVPMARRADETDVVLARMLHYGVTSVLVLGGTDQSTDMVNALRARQAEGELKGPWIYGTGGHLTLPGAHPVATIFPPEVRQAADHFLAVQPPEAPADLYEIGIGISLVRTDEAARTAVRERAAGGMDAIKITVESGPGPFGAHHPRMPLSMIRAIVDEAALHGLKVFAHVSSPDELMDVLDGGAAGVLHAVIDAPLPGRAVGERMHRENFYYVPTLTLYENFIGYWNEPSRFDDSFLRATVSADEVASFRDPGFAERHRSTFDYFDGPVTSLPATGATREPAPPKRTEATVENVGSLHSLGVPMVVGTDTGNPFTFPGYSVHQELELLVGAGLTPADALVAATLRAAEMLGKEDDFGTIEAGKRADLVLLDANPLDDIRNTRMIGAVVANGMYLDRAALEALVAGDARDAAAVR